MNSDTTKLTLDRPVVYQIKVPGNLDEGVPIWDGQTQISVKSQSDDPPVTTLTGTFDQAALQGLLRRLYSLGLPLISVVCLECGLEEQQFRMKKNKQSRKA